MTIEEVREIKERISLEIVGMSVDEMNAYFAKGTAEVEKKIDAIRKQKEAENKRVATGAGV
jgi:hypothetical protein